MHVYVCEQMTYCGNKREKAGSSWIFHEYVKEWHIVEVTRQRVTLRSLLLSVGRLRRPFRKIIFFLQIFHGKQIKLIFLALVLILTLLSFEVNYHQCVAAQVLSMPFWRAMQHDEVQYCQERVSIKTLLSSFLIIQASRRLGALYVAHNKVVQSGQFLQCC